MTELKDVDKRIREDYLKVAERIKNIVSGEEGNNLVLCGNYTHPIFSQEVLPLDAEKGKLKYFIRVRAPLEEAVLKGRISEGMMPSHAPDYLKALGVRDYHQSAMPKTISRQKIPPSIISFYNFKQ